MPPSQGKAAVSANKGNRGSTDFLKPCVVKDGNGYTTEKEAGDPMGRRHVYIDQAMTSCLASATSTESPSWLRTSSPDSGTSPDVLCDTVIFLAISPRQVICDVAA